MSEIAAKTRVVVAAAIVICAALLAAGCGGSGGAGGSRASGPPLTKAAYEAKVAEIVKGLNARYGRISSDPTTLSPTGLAQVQGGLRYLADRLDRLNPPAEVRDLHDRYVGAVRALADELPDLTAKVKENPASGLETLLASKPFATLLGISQAFRQKGYDVNLKG